MIGGADRPTRIQRKGTNGWRMPASAVYVGRPSKFGNPYDVLLFGDDRERLMNLYRHFLTTTPIGQELLALARRKLCGKDLACWCRLEEPCHADVLLELANSEVGRWAEETDAPHAC